MTKQRNDNHSTEFGLWLRNQPQLESSRFDAENLDYIWFAYRNGWLITVEEKRHGASPSNAQNDTHSIVKQMLENASGNEYKTMRGKRKIEYRGHYLIQFEKTNPDDSKWIKINGVECTKMELIFLLVNGKLVKFPQNAGIMELCNFLQLTPGETSLFWEG